MNVGETLVPTFSGLASASADAVEWLASNVKPRRNVRRWTAADVIPHELPLLVRVAHRDPNGWGFIPEEAGRQLVASLGSPRRSCSYLLWDGFGFLDNMPREPGLTVAIGGRRYYAYVGPLERWRAFHEHGGLPLQTAAYWWADDRSWLVYTDIDANATLLATRTSALADAIQAEMPEAAGVDRSTPI